MLSTFNLVALFFGIIIAGFLVYEIYHFLKETKKGKVKLPSFKEKQFSQASISIPQQVQKKNINPKKIGKTSALLGFSVLILMLSIGYFIYGENLLGSSAGNSIVKTVESKGIIIFSNDWKQLNEEDITNLKAGDTIIIGIEKTEDSTIKKARIRINSSQWSSENETVDFNPDYNVFYIRYTLKPEDETLNIEAQLFSEVSGWLVD